MHAHCFVLFCFMSFVRYAAFDEHANCFTSYLILLLSTNALFWACNLNICLSVEKSFSSVTWMISIFVCIYGFWFCDSLFRSVCRRNITGARDWRNYGYSFIRLLAIVRCECEIAFRSEFYVLFPSPRPFAIINLYLYTHLRSSAARNYIAKLYNNISLE